MSQIRYGFKTPSRKFRWEEFDALPREVRDELNVARMSYATGTLYKAYRDGAPTQALINSIRASDQKYLAMVEAERAKDDERREAERFLKECGL